MKQDLVPSMEDGEKAHVRAEILGFCGDGSQGLGSGLKEQVVAQTLVLQRDGCQLVGKGEDDVEVRDVEEFTLSGGEPFGSCGGLTLGAVPVAAGVVGDLFVAAGIAAKLVTAKRCRPTEREQA